jgi:hypothetical protein
LLCAKGNKKMKIKIKFLFARILGYGYLVNLRSKEIHRLNSKYTQCNLDSIKKYKFIKKKQITVWMQYGYNGCRFCMPEIDTDINNELKIFFI